MKKSFLKILVIIFLAAGLFLSQAARASQGAQLYVPDTGRQTAGDNGVWNIFNTAAQPQLLAGTYTVGAKTYSTVDWSSLFSTYGKNENWLQLAAKFNLNVQVCPAKLVVERFGTAVSSFTSVPLLRKTWENNCKDLKLGLSGVPANKNIGIELKLVLPGDGTYTVSKIKYNGVEKAYTDEAWGTSKNLALYDATSGAQVGWDATAMYIFTIKGWDNVYNDIPGGQGQNATPKGAPLSTGGLSATVQIVVPPTSGLDAARVTELQGDRGDIRLRLSGGTLPAYLGFTEVGKRTFGDHYNSLGQRVFGMFLRGEFSSKDDFEINGVLTADVLGNVTSDTRVLRMTSGPDEIKSFITNNKVTQKGRLASRTDAFSTVVTWEYLNGDQDNLNNQLPVWIYSRDLGNSNTGYEINLYQGGTLIFADSGFGSVLTTFTNPQGFYIYNHIFNKVGADYEVGQQGLARYDRGRVYKLAVKNKQTGKSKEYILWPKNIEDEMNVQNQSIGLWSDTSHQLRGAGVDYNPESNSGFAFDDMNLGNVGTWPTNSLFTEIKNTTSTIANASYLQAVALTPPTRTLREQTKWGTNLMRAVGTPFVSATRPVNSYVLQIYDVAKVNYVKYCMNQGYNSASYLNSAIFGGDDQLKKAGISKRFSGAGLSVPVTATQIRLNKVEGLGVTVSPTLVKSSTMSILKLPNLAAHFSTDPNNPNIKYYVLDGATYDSDFVEGPSQTYYNRFDGKNVNSLGITSYDVSTLANLDAGCSYIVLYGSSDTYNSELPATSTSFEGYTWMMKGAAIFGQRPTGLINYNGRIARQNVMTAKGDEAFTQENAFEDLTWDQLKAKPKVPGALGVITRDLTMNNWVAHVGTGQIGFAWARPAEYAYTINRVPQNYQFTDASSFPDGQAGFIFYEIVKNGVAGGVQVRPLKDATGTRFEALTVNDVAATDRVQLYIAYMDTQGSLSDVFMKDVKMSNVIDFRDEGKRPALRMTAANVYQTENGAYNLTSPTANPNPIPTQYAHQAAFYSTADTDFCGGAGATATDPILKWFYNNNALGFKVSRALAAYKVNIRKKVGASYTQVKEIDVPGGEVCVRLGNQGLDFIADNLAFAVRALDVNGLTSDWAVVGKNNATVTKYWNEGQTTTGASTGTAGSSQSLAPSSSNYQALPNAVAQQMNNATPNASSAGANVVASKAYRPVGLFIDQNNLYYQRLTQPAGTTKKGLVLKSPTVNPTYYPLTEFVYNQADDINNGQRAIIVNDGQITDPNIPSSCEGSAATKTRPIVLTYTIAQAGFQIIPGTTGTILGYEFYLERQQPGTRNWFKIPGTGTEPPQLSGGAQTPLTLLNPEQFKAGATACYQPSNDLIDGNYRITVKAVSTEKNSASPVAGNRTAYLKSDRMAYEFSVVAGGAVGNTGNSSGQNSTNAGASSLFIRPSGAFKKPLPPCLKANPPCMLPVNPNDVDYQVPGGVGKLNLTPAKKNPKVAPIWTDQDEQASLTIDTAGVCNGDQATLIKPHGLVPAASSSYDGFNIYGGLGSIQGYEYVLEVLSGTRYVLASNLVKNATQFSRSTCYVPVNDLPTAQYRLNVKAVLDQRDPANLSQFLKSDIFSSSFIVNNPNSSSTIIPGAGSGNNGQTNLNGGSGVSGNQTPATFINP